MGASRPRPPHRWCAVRHWLIALWWVGVALAAPSPARAELPSYHFAPVNQYGVALTAAYWNPIVAYVSERSGVRLQLKIGRTSAETTGFVLANEVDFVFSNHLFSPGRDSLGWRVFGRRNTPALHGQIVVPADSPIQSLTQLEGRSVAFSGPEAFVIYKVPHAHLRAQGVSVNVVFAGNQDAAFAQLFSGKVQAAGGNSQLVEGHARREGRQFRVLWSSPPFQDLALMASGRVPARHLRAVAEAFVHMHTEPRGRAILARVAREVGLDEDAHFIAASAADYQSYRSFFESTPKALH